MAKLKPLLFVFSFMLFTLIGETVTTATPIQDAIDEALALIDEAIDEAFALVDEAIDEDPAPTEGAFDEAFALIEGAIDESIALIEQAIEEQVQAIDEQTIDEDTVLIAEAFNEDIQNTIEAIAHRLLQNQFNVFGCDYISCGCDDTCCECEDPCDECEDPYDECEDPCDECEDPCDECEDPCDECEDPCDECEDTCDECEDPCDECEDPCDECEDPCDECEDPCCECEATWPEEEDCIGSIVIGIVCACEITEDYNLITCAEQGGNYILSTAKGNFCSDEAYALCRLSQICSNPADNPWRTAVSDFYQDVKNSVDGTEGYISQFAAAETSTVVSHLAYYVIAAHYVDAEDKEIWREELINYLSRIGNDFSDSPVMALGIATWSLATTGPLDDTPIDPYRTGTLYWSGTKLEDLPALLVSHQVPDGDLYAGSFYWRFDHDAGDLGSCVSGYTEDIIFATLGLISASQANSDLHLDAAINSACQTLLDAVNSEGNIVEHLGAQNSDSCTFGGEMLLVLSEQVNNSFLTPAIKIGAR